MIETYLVPQGTTVTAKGEGAPVDISAAGHRVFLLSLVITRVVEQEALDVAVQGSANGTDWSDKALLSFSQKFYTGEHPLLLDLTGDREVKFLRARWEVNRWGRGDTQPSFEFHVALREVPPDVLAEASAPRKPGR